jgi:hypothetical protein
LTEGKNDKMYFFEENIVYCVITFEDEKDLNIEENKEMKRFNITDQRKTFTSSIRHGSSRFTVL